MSKIFETSNGGGLLLYTSDDKIFLRRKIYEDFSKGILLARDYKSALSETRYDNTIYYSYINKNDHLILKRTSDQSILFLMEDYLPVDEFDPILITFSGRLILFYEAFENEKYIIKGLLPFRPDLSFDLPFQSNAPVLADVCPVADALITQIKNSEGTFLFSTDTRLHTIKMDAVQEVDNSQIDTLKSVVHEQNKTIDLLTEKLKSAITQYNDLMKVATEYKNEAIKWHDKFYQ